MNVWTASVPCPFIGGVLKAQSIGAPDGLAAKLMADDPIWKQKIHFSLEPAWPPVFYRGDVAIRAFESVGVRPD